MARLAAILTLAILGHGLLMASRADAAAHGEHGQLAMSLVAAMPAVEAPAGGETCFTVQTVIEPAPLPVPSGARIAPLPSDAPDRIALPQTRAASPHRPPDTVRALLQVYRL